MTFESDHPGLKGIAYYGDMNPDYDMVLFTPAEALNMPWLVDDTIGDGNKWPKMYAIFKAQDIAETQLDREKVKSAINKMADILNEEFGFQPTMQYAYQEIKKELGL